MPQLASGLAAMTSARSLRCTMRHAWRMSSTVPQWMPAVFHRGPTTGNQMQPATARIFPRSDRVHVELEAVPGSPTWMGVLLDRNGTRTVVPVTVGERTDSGSGQRWLTADVTLAPLGAGDYVIELSSLTGTEQRRTLVAIRVTQ